MSTSTGDFNQLFNIKGAILGLHMSNPVPSNSLRPILPNFMTFHILLNCHLNSIWNKCEGGQSSHWPLRFSQIQYNCDLTKSSSPSRSFITGPLRIFNLPSALLLCQATHSLMKFGSPMGLPIVFFCLHIFPYGKREERGKKLLV